MHKLLTILLILFFALLILIKFWLINVPEFIPIGSDIGEIVESISISYIAAYIFYLLQVWYPNLLKERKARQKFISPLENIKYNLERLFKEFFKNENPYDIQDIKEENIKEINLLAGVTLYAIAYDVGKARTADYIEYLEHIHSNLVIEIEKINYWNDFDIELRELLQKILECSSFNMENKNFKARRTMMPHMRISASEITKELNELLQSYKKLINYMSKNEKRLNQQLIK